MTSSISTRLLLFFALVASVAAVPRFDLNVSPQTTVDNTKSQFSDPYLARAEGQGAIKEAQAAMGNAMRAGEPEFESKYAPYRKEDESLMYAAAHAIAGHERRRHHARIVANKRQDAPIHVPQAMTVDIFPFATTAAFRASASPTAPATAETMAGDEQSDLANNGIFGSLDEEHEKGEKSHRHKMIAIALTVTVIGVTLLLAAIKIVRIAQRKRKANKAAEKWRESFVNSLVEEKQAHAAETSDVSLASTRSFKTAQSDRLTSITRIPTPLEQQPFMDMSIRKNFLPIAFARALSPPHSRTPPADPLPEAPKPQVPEHYAQLIQPHPESILNWKPSPPPKASPGASRLKSPHKRACSAPDFPSLGAAAAVAAPATVAGSVSNDAYWEMLDIIGRPESNGTTNHLSRSSSQTSKARSSRSKSEILRRISDMT